jgi:AMMECR1 domain-containing protein
MVEIRCRGSNMMIEEGPAHRDLTHRDHRTHHQAVKAAGAEIIRGKEIGKKEIKSIVKQIEIMINPQRITVRR